MKKPMLKKAYVEKLIDMGEAPFGLTNDKAEQAMAWLAAENEALARESGAPKKFGGDAWTTKLASLDKGARFYGAGTSQNRIATRRFKEGVTGIGKGIGGVGKAVARAVTGAGKSIASAPGNVGRSLGSRGKMNRAVGYDSWFDPKESLPKGGITERASGLLQSAKKKLGDRKLKKEIAGMRPTDKEDKIQNVLGLR